MTQNEMISNLAEKCSVDSEEARTALEIGEWNMLTAAQLLESEKLRKAQEIEEVVSNCETATAQATAQAVADAERAMQTKLDEVRNKMQDKQDALRNKLDAVLDELAKIKDELHRTQTERDELARKIPQQTKSGNE